MQLLLVDVKVHESTEPGHGTKYEYVFKGETGNASVTLNDKVEGWEPGDEYDLSLGLAGQ